MKIKTFSNIKYKNTAKNNCECEAIYNGETKVGLKK